MGRGFNVLQMGTLSISLCSGAHRQSSGASASYWPDGGLGRGAAPGELTVPVEAPSPAQVGWRSYGHVWSPCGVRGAFPIRPARAAPPVTAPSPCGLWGAVTAHRALHSSPRRWGGMQLTHLSSQQLSGKESVSPFTERKPRLGRSHRKHHSWPNCEKEPDGLQNRPFSLAHQS